MKEAKSKKNFAEPKKPELEVTFQVGYSGADHPHHPPCMPHTQEVVTNEEK